MSAPEITLRFFAERESDGSWFAMCVDLNLYARADSYPEVRKQVEAIVHDYMDDALGRDREHYADLVPRRAPLRFFLRYWQIVAINSLRRITRMNGSNGRSVQMFQEHLPLKLA